MIQAWPLERSDYLADYRIFRVRRDWKVSPRTSRNHDFFVLECPDWVNVVALTPSQELIVVEQYRHGTNTVELEIPGGVMDTNDGSPLATGIRELREETGYAGDPARIIGSVAPNPAIMNNTCFTVLVENCAMRHDVLLDPGEDLVTRLIPQKEIPALVAAGRIRHSLVVAALCHYWLLMENRSVPQA